MVTSHIGISSLNSCFPSLPRLPRPCFTKCKPFAVAAMSDDPISVWILSEGNATQITRTSSIGGGCINNARRMLVLSLQKQTGREDFLLFKCWIRGIEPSLFEGEALGLGAMYETRTIQVPGPFKVGPLPTSGPYIMMEFIEFGVCRGNQFVLGRKLAEMHKPSLFENIDRAILTSWRLVEWEYQL